MKKTIFSIVLFLMSIFLFAQKQKKNTPISIAYFGPYIIQSGVKLGASFTIFPTVFKNQEDDTTNKIKSLYVSPQIGFFAKSNNHISFLLNADIGYKRLKTKRRFYTAYALGIGYLSEHEVLSLTVDLSSGNVTNKNREQRGYFLPTINYELGQEGKKRIGWYSKIALGRKMFSKVEGSTFFALEAGLKIKL